MFFFAARASASVNIYIYICVCVCACVCEVCVYVYEEAILSTHTYTDDTKLLFLSSKSVGKYMYVVHICTHASTRVQDLRLASS